MSFFRGLFGLLMAVICACAGSGSTITDPPPPPPAPPSSSPPVAGVWPYRGDTQIDGISSSAHGLYAAGYFVGQADFGDGNVLQSVASGGTPTKDIYIAKHRMNGALEWVRHFGGAGVEGNIYDIATSADDVTYASGAFSGTVAFDDIALTATLEAGRGSSSSGTYGNMVLAAIEGSGRVRWALQAKGDVLSGGNEVAVDAWGAIAQVGIFGGTASPGGALHIDGIQVGFEGGRFDSYVAKFSPDGAALWVKHIGGMGAQRGKAVAADADGNILVAGDAWGGETRFASGQGFAVADAQPGQDFWVAKYDPSGSLLWWRTFASSGMDEVKGIGADADGNVIVAAAFTGPSLQLLNRTASSASPGMDTGVVFKLAADGSQTLWLNTLSFVNKCCELEVDSRGHTYAATGAVGPSVQDATGAEFAVGGMPRGGLLIEFDATGAVVRTQTVTADRAELGELTVLSNGAVGLAGSFEGTELRSGDLVVVGDSRRTQVVLVMTP